MYGIALCVALLAPLQGTTSEYTFKHSKAALLIKNRWKTVFEPLVPGIQLATSLENPPPTGPWVFLDEKRNRLVFGSRDDSAEHMPRYMAEFDVKPWEIRLVIGLSRQDLGLKLSGTIQTASNQTVTFGTSELGAMFEFRPRMSNDGTVLIQIMMTTVPEGVKSSCYAQVDSFGTITLQILGGKAAFIKGPKSRSGEKILTAPTGDAWKPFKIDIAAIALEYK